MSGGFNPFYDKYLSGRGMKRPHPEDGQYDEAPSKRFKPNNYTSKLTSLRLFGPNANSYRRKALPGETKGMDTDVSQSAIIGTTNTNVNIGALNLIRTGTGSWNRIGRKTHLVSARLKGSVQFTCPPTSPIGQVGVPALRMMLVWDKQPSGGSIPTFDTMFGITTQGGTESCPDTTCPLKYDNMDRFVVISDWSFACPPVGFPSSGTGVSTIVTVPVDKYVKLNNLESVYSGQSEPMTIADISTGALYLVSRTVGLLFSSSVDFDGIVRLRYKD